MLTIRREQMAVFSMARVESFVEKMIGHHRKFFAAWARTLGADGLEDFVRHGIRRANAYGFETELDIARYLHAMQALGKTFDESSEYPWASKLLNKSLPARVKMNRLRDAAQYEMEARRISHVAK